MNYSRTLTPVCSLLATALLALAQPPPPRAAAAPMPPDAWEQTPAPRPAAAPMAPMPPMEPMPPMPAMAPMDINLGDIDAQISLAKELTLSPELQDNLEAVKEQAERMKFDLRETMVDREEMVAAAREMAM